MTDSMKAVGQHVHHIAADEFDCGERHDGVAGFVCALACWLSVAERDGLPIEAGHAGVADGHAVGVARQIADQLPRSGEGPFRVDIPLDCTGGFNQRLEGLRVAMAFDTAGKDELTVAISELQLFEETAAEIPCQHLDWCEEGAAAGFPLAGADIEAGIGDHRVSVWVPQDFLIPRMQHHGAADAGAEALGVGGNGDQGFGCHPHQDGQYRLAIGVGQFGDRLRQREHDMEIRRRQYALELLVKPPTRAGALACAAMAIPARVVQDARHLALFAVVQARTHRRGATVDDGVEHAPRSGVEQVAELGDKRTAGATEDVRHATAVGAHRLTVQLIGRMIQTLEHRRGDARIRAGALRRLVTEKILNLVARRAALKQMSRIRMTK